VGEHLYNEGAEVTLTAIPAEGWVFERWVVDGEETTQNPTTQTITADMAATAHFVEDTTITPVKFSLSLAPNPTEGGTVSGAGDYEADAEVEVTATPTEGYQFISWTQGDAVISTTASFTYTMPDSSVALVAQFEEVAVTPEQYTLTLTIAGSGTVLVNGTAYTAPVTVDEGTELTLEATADANHQFDGWSGDATGASTTLSVTMDGSMSITATFSPVSSASMLSLADVQVFPNPFRSTLTLGSMPRANRVVVTSLLGSQVIDVSLNGQEQVTLHTGELTPGLYLINIYSTNGERVVRRVIKE